MPKNTKRIRMFGGNDFQIKIATTWTNLGHLIKGIIRDMTETQNITLTDGEQVGVDGARSCQLVVTIGQSSKEEMELVDDLRGKEFEAYYYNGVIDGKHQEIYIKALKMIPKMELEIPATPQAIVFEGIMQPQPANVSVTPSSGLPAGAFATSASPVTGKNRFYLTLETTVA